MIKLSTLGVMLLALLIFGCGPSEEAKPAQGSKETATEKVAEASRTAAEEAKKMGEVVVDKAVDMEKQAEPAVKEAVEKTKDATVKAGEVVVETVKTAAVATTMAAGKAVDAAKQAVSPETIVLEASYGNITFPHAMHSSSYDCSTCHGDATPGLFGLDKEKAHVLCKDCHKKIGAGPVDCKGCHKK